MLDIGFRRCGVVRQHELELPDARAQGLRPAGGFERSERFRSFTDLACQDRQPFRVKRCLSSPVGDPHREQLHGEFFGQIDNSVI